MIVQRLYALRKDMRPEQEFYCAQPIFSEFVHAHEYDALKALNAELLEALESLLNEFNHTPPDSCYSTGPFTGNVIQDFVLCPGCAVADQARAAIAKAKEAA